MDGSVIINSIIDVLNTSNVKSSSDKIIGTDVTNEFFNYSRLEKNFTNLNKIVTSWDNKFLAYGNNTISLFQISDNKLYLKSLHTPDINELEFAYIFRSGNILFCDNQYAYYSHDNLLTYHRSEVLDIDGKPYQPNKQSNFFSLVIDRRQIIDDKEIRVWGNYSNYGKWEIGNYRSEQVQVWYTVDEGKTIKMAYKFGESMPQLLYRHIHAVNMCPWDNTFWVQTGDGQNECHWLQGKYDFKKDSWNWDVKATGNEMSFCKSTGFVFFDDYVYWSDDSSNPERHGIWRTTYKNLISNRIESSMFENTLSTDKEIAMLNGTTNGFLIAIQYYKSSDNKYKIFYSRDGGTTWNSVNTALQIINIHPPNSFGNILGNYFLNQDSFEAIHYWDGTPSIFVDSYLKDQ